MIDCDDNDPSLPTTPGTACDDGDANTTNDQIQGDGCTCLGIIVGACDNNGGDADGDGVCANDDCDDSDASIPAPAGTACDDGDANTSNDMIQADECTCAGTIIDPCINDGGDADGDGVCAADDCDDSDASIPAPAGTACDDGDANTTNDQIQSDECTCAGTPVSTGCTGSFVAPGDGTIVVSGLTAPNQAVQIFNDIWQTEFTCNNTCSNPEIVSLPNGSYFVKVQMWDANWQAICTVEDFVIITNSGICTLTGTACDDNDSCTDNDEYDTNCQCVGTPSGDADGDGVCTNDDCDDSDASIPAIPGTACDDGDANTFGDVILIDGCTCQGTTPVSCNNFGGDADGDGVCAVDDCDDSDASIPAPAGTACDDGDANTTNDIIQSDECTCAGTPITTGCGLDYTISGRTLTITGLNGPHNSINLFDTDNGWQTVLSCFDDCDNPQVIDNLPDGEYYLHVKILDASYQITCDITEYININGPASLVQPISNLLVFDAQRDDREVRLNWVTNTEFMNDLFVIERSANGIDFEALMEVDAFGNAVALPVTYQDKDVAPLFGKNFYRLKQIYNDGSYRYSVAKEVVFDIDLRTFGLFPNPTSDELFVNLKDFAGKAATIQVYNPLGQLMDQVIVDELAEAAVRINVSDYRSGLYTIAVKVEDRKMMTEHFIKIGL